MRFIFPHRLREVFVSASAFVVSVGAWPKDDERRSYVRSTLPLIHAAAPSSTFGVRD